jgi:hypothetical protein
MNSTKGWSITWAVIAFGLCLSISTAQADEPYDITVCGSATWTSLIQSPELSIMSIDYKGIARSNVEGKFLDNCTVHHVRVTSMAMGKSTSHGFTKFLSPDGDALFVEVSEAGGEAMGEFLAGTGKWKGIRGHGKITPLAQGRPVAPGTFQNCVRHTGAFELPE